MFNPKPPYDLHPPSYALWLVMGLFICIVLFFVFGGFIGVSVIGMHFHPKGKNQKSTDEIEEFEEIKVTYENENDKMYDNLNVSKL